MNEAPDFQEMELGGATFGFSELFFTVIAIALLP
jgi:hypothetical protein